MAYQLPTTRTETPQTDRDLTTLVAEAYADQIAVYPLGGGTSLDFGPLPKVEGWAIELTALNQVVDYPYDDMTITVGSGIRMSELSAMLEEHGQQLPMDVPLTEQATLGGVLATNFSGPRRYGYGTGRDYVIGISAVDGRGQPFSGGGRVVKNVAGYDFCKLLIGSLGTVGIITEVTLKLKPKVQQFQWLACGLDNLIIVEQLLNHLGTSGAHPVAIELLTGPAWEDHPHLAQLNGIAYLLVGFEGRDEEVDWMFKTLTDEYRSLGASQFQRISNSTAAELLRDVTNFPSVAAPLVVQIGVVASGTLSIVEAVQRLDSGASIAARAGNGVIIVRFSETITMSLSDLVVGSLRPLAMAHQGHLTVLSNADPADLTPQAAWGGGGKSWSIMSDIKRQFDPHNILNPGRLFVRENQ